MKQSSSITESNKSCYYPTVKGKVLSGIPCSKEALRKIYARLGNPFSGIKVIAIAGCIGKSVTQYFLKKLLMVEYVKAGSLSYSFSFNDLYKQISIQDKSISESIFLKLRERVLEVAQVFSDSIHPYQVAALCAGLYFKSQKIDLALIESSFLHRSSLQESDVLNILNINIMAISEVSEEKTLSVYGLCINKKTSVITSIQNRLFLAKLEEIVKNKNGELISPVRKLPQLPAPWLQLYGRCAALAQSTASLFINNEQSLNPDDNIFPFSFLVKRKLVRGRPRLGIKKKIRPAISGLYHVDSLDDFWGSVDMQDFAGHCSQYRYGNVILLTDAIDSLMFSKNVLLAAKLQCYQNVFDEIVVIFDCDTLADKSERIYKTYINPIKGLLKKYLHTVCYFISSESKVFKSNILPDSIIKKCSYKELLDDFVVQKSTNKKKLIIYLGRNYIDKISVDIKKIEG